MVPHLTKSDNDDNGDKDNDKKITTIVVLTDKNNHNDMFYQIEAAFLNVFPILKTEKEKVN